MYISRGTGVAILIALVAATSSVSADIAFDDNVVLPLCHAYDDKAEMEHDLALERSNPSGVVDLERMHFFGAAIQADEYQIKILTPAYVKVRKHPFRGWATEAACVSEKETAWAAAGCVKVENPGKKSHHWVCPDQ